MRWLTAVTLACALSSSGCITYLGNKDGPVSYPKLIATGAWEVALPPLVAIAPLADETERLPYWARYLLWTGVAVLGDVVLWAIVKCSADNADCGEE